MNPQARMFLGKIRTCLDMLDSRDRLKLYAAATAQSLLGFLDLLGVALIGLVSMLATARMQQQETTDKNILYRYLNFGFLDSDRGLLLLFSLSVVLMILKTVLSIFLTRRIIYFLSMKSAAISSSLISRLLTMPISFIRRDNIHETIYSVTRGVELVTLQVLSVGAILVSDLFLLIIILIGLTIIDFTTALSIFVVFFSLGYILYRLMHVRAGKLGYDNASANISSNQKIYEAIISYRESFVRNRRFYYAKSIAMERTTLAKSSGEITFMPYISKYVLEIGVILGAVLISALQFLLNDTSKAVATVVIFITAGLRVAPAVLRIQQSVVQMNWSLGQSKTTLILHNNLREATELAECSDEINFDHSGFSPNVDLINLDFSHPGSGKKLFENVNIHIPTGSFVAFVGPSGSGKSTLADLVLGILEPDAGDVLISGMNPSTAIAKWPGAISYVPQEVFISSGTVLENITLGYPLKSISIDCALEAASNADLNEYISSQDEGVDTFVGENGSQISGGQRQRLSLARGLYSRPKLIVLDEATSSLDSYSEARVSNAVSKLGNGITIIMIAHRISSIKSADKIYYIEDGNILGAGTFEELKLQVPKFANAAELMDV